VLKMMQLEPLTATAEKADAAESSGTDCRAPTPPPAPAFDLCHGGSSGCSFRSFRFILFGGRINHDHGIRGIRRTGKNVRNFSFSLVHRPLNHDPPKAFALTKKNFFLIREPFRNYGV
jgi:hypothetical protein